MGGSTRFQVSRTKSDKPYASEVVRALRSTEAMAAGIEKALKGAVGQSPVPSLEFVAFRAWLLNSVLVWNLDFIHFVVLSGM
jgi:hypothetical protein